MNKSYHLTQNEVSKIKAGRTLDVLIAKKVFNLDVVADSSGYSLRNDGKYPGRAPFLELPKYSKDMSAAWEVVDKISVDYEITITKAGGYKVGCLLIVSASEDWILAEADTAPLAICRAALLAVTRAE